MRLTREERETIVRTSDADDHWVISTASPKLVRKFTRLGYPKAAGWCSLDGYMDFRVPFNLVSFRRPKRMICADQKLG